MPERVIIEPAASITELKKNPIQVAESGQGEAVAILNGNSPVFYCIPASGYELLMDYIEDLELAKIVNERKDQETVTISIDDLDVS